MIITDKLAESAIICQPRNSGLHYEHSVHGDAALFAPLHRRPSHNPPHGDT
jgi:hypothetical protein